MGWLAIVKAVLPHAGTIVNLATPVFTKMKNQETVAEQPELLEKQIEELQGAVVQNATHLKDLAAQLQSTATALEQAMLASEEKIKRANRYCAVAIGVSVVSCLIALAALLSR